MPSFVALDPQKEIRDPEDGSQINPPGFCLFYLPFQDDLRYVFYKNCSSDREKLCIMLLFFYHRKRTVA